MFRSSEQQLLVVLIFVTFFSCTNAHGCFFYALKSVINIITSGKKLLAPFVTPDPHHPSDEEAELLTPFIRPDPRQPYETHLPARLLERFPDQYCLAALRARSPNGNTLWHFAAQHLELPLMFHLREKVPALDAWTKNYKGETPQDLLNQKQREILRSLNRVRDEKQMMLTLTMQQNLTTCEKLLKQAQKKEYL